jgi:hypothetical protein
MDDLIVYFTATPLPGSEDENEEDYFEYYEKIGPAKYFAAMAAELKRKMDKLAGYQVFIVRHVRLGFM